MIVRRIYSLFRRYMAAHHALNAPPQDIRDLHGELVGHIDMARAERDRIKVSGWVTGDRVTLTVAESVQVVERASDTHGQAPLVFHFAAPFLGKTAGGPVDIILEAEGALALKLDLRHGSKAALLFGFLRASVAAVPATLRWRRYHDPVDKAKVKRLFGLDETPQGGLIPDALFTNVTPPQGDAPKRSIVIILPVYNAHDVLRECLDRLERHTDLPWHLIIVEDCSSDDRVRPYLETWAAQRPAEVTLLLRDQNKGFIESVNAGFEAAQARFATQPVVLLNSDALVPARWASRLLAPMLEVNDVASVTPMSNDAELLSVPTICAPTSLLAGAVDLIDAEAERLSAAFSSPDLPTGVGFCMALNPKYLRQIPKFDTAFGRGYGEEVDWCQKAVALGGRHVAQHRLFVEHRGGQSFTPKEKKTAILQNGQLISSRYPGFDAEVQEIIAADQLRGPRLSLAVTWAAGVVEAAESVPIYLCHALGGGAELALQQLVASRANTGKPTLLLRVGGTERWQLEVVGPSGITHASIHEFAVLKRLLEPLTRRHVVYSCGVGDKDPASLPEHLLALATGPDDTLEVMFHDYLPISPDYTLLNQDGVYYRDAHRAPALATWQARWGALIETAKQVTVFSRSSERIVTETWPGSAGRINLAPHHALNSVVPMTPLPHNIPPDMPPNAPRVVAVLGNINHHKGGMVLRRLAHMTKQGHPFRLIVIGNVDPTLSLPAHLKVHGTYYGDQINPLARQYGVTDWLIPSVWPETFSFTTHEALATGLPVFAFDIGAQGDAVTAAKNGIAVPYMPDDTISQTMFDAITTHRSLRTGSSS
ncbi:MAG: glycosyltransferase [Pseudomonadota bacterium]